MGSANSKHRAIQQCYEEICDRGYNKECDIELLIVGYLRSNNIDSSDVLKYLHSFITRYFTSTIALKSVLFLNDDTTKSRVVRYSQRKGEIPINRLVGMTINGNEIKTHTAAFRIISKHEHVTLMIAVKYNDAYFTYLSNGSIDGEYPHGTMRKGRASPYDVDDFIKVEITFFGDGDNGFLRFQKNDEDWIPITKWLSPTTKNAEIIVSALTDSFWRRDSSIALIGYFVRANKKE